MPIDPGIYDRLIQPLQKPDSPLAIMQGVANLRDSAALAQDRRSLIQERMQKAQLEAQDRQEQAQMQTVVQQNGGDIEKSYPQLSAINAEKADKYLQAHLQNAELQSKLGEIDTQKKSTVAGYVTKNLQGVQNQHDYDVARAQIQSARTLVGLPPASEQEMPAVYDPARVSQMIQNGQMTQEVLGKQQKGTPAFYTLPGDPTPHLMKTTPDGQVIWNGQDVREQAQPWDKTAGAEDKVQSAEIEAIKAFTAAHGRKPTEAELDGIHKRFKEAGTVVRVSTGGAGGGPEIEIKPGTRHYRTAVDLASGALPLADFQRMFGRGQQLAGLKEAMYDTAKQINPEFSPAAYEMGLKVASNPKIVQQVGSINNVLSGVPDLLSASNAASNSGIRLLNSYIPKGGLMVGGKAYSNLKTARTAFADELSGALGYGSATDMSREMGFDMTDTTLSPDKFQSAIQDIVIPFVNRKKKSITDTMGVYGKPGMSPAAGPATPVTPALRWDPVKKTWIK
jgi:hypothetical protein